MSKQTLIRAKICVLRDAKNRIKWRECDYVCLAVLSAQRRRRHPDIFQARTELVAYINRALGKCNATLSEWQARQGIYHSWTEQRVDRIEWIKWMIRQLKHELKENP